MEVIFENGTPSTTFGDLGLFDTFICPSLYPKDYVFMDIGDGYAACITSPNADADFSENQEVLKVKITSMTIKLV
jgi:hypothetical protein